MKTVATYEFAMRTAKLDVEAHRFVVDHAQDLPPIISLRRFPANEPSAIKVLHGSLAGCSTLDIVQLLEQSQSSGLLELFGCTGTALIWFSGGTIYDAKLSEIVIDAPEKAVLRALLWTDGSFSFCGTDTPPPRNSLASCMTNEWSFKAVQEGDESALILGKLPRDARISRSMSSDKISLIEDDDFFQSAIKAPSVQALLNTRPETDRAILRRLGRLIELEVLSIPGASADAFQLSIGKADVTDLDVDRAFDLFKNEDL